jgi:hypothetical protein
MRDPSRRPFQYTMLPKCSVCNRRTNVTGKCKRCVSPNVTTESEPTTGTKCLRCGNPVERPRIYCVKCLSH